MLQSTRNEEMKKSAAILMAITSLASATACSKKTQESSAQTVAADAAALAAQVASVATTSVPSADAPHIKVYKDANCGCCKAWIEHLQQNGFVVEAMDMPDLSAVKTRYGVKEEIQACHTGIVNGYAIEGHVPADVILKMLKEKPAIAGLAVPGMPAGSPGMEGAIKEKYDVLTFDRAGRTTVYATR